MTCNGNCGRIEFPISELPSRLSETAEKLTDGNIRATREGIASIAGHYQTQEEQSLNEVIATFIQLSADMTHSKDECLTTFIKVLNSIIDVLIRCRRHTCVLCNEHMIRL